MFDGWLFNNIKWLMVSDDKRKFKVTPSKKIFSGSEPILFKGQAYDDSYNPVPGVEINLKITAPDGKQNGVHMNQVGEANYFMELFNLGEKEHIPEALGRKDEVRIGTDKRTVFHGKSMSSFQATGQSRHASANCPSHRRRIYLCEISPNWTKNQGIHKA
ncbi:MAG: hypothetical protein R3B93_26240 [Bacteroidia bacterium]